MVKVERNHEVDCINWQKKLEILAGGDFSPYYKAWAWKKFLLEGDGEDLDLLVVMYYRMRDYQLAYYFAHLGWERKKNFFYRFYEVLSLLQLGYYEMAADIFWNSWERFCMELENIPVCAAEIMDMFVVFFFPSNSLPACIKEYYERNSNRPEVMLYALQEKILMSENSGQKKKLLDYIADILVYQLDGNRALYNHACTLIAVFDEKRRERYLSYVLEEGWLEPLVGEYIGERAWSLNNRDFIGTKKGLMPDKEKIRNQTKFYYQGLKDETFEIISYPWSYNAGSMHIVKVQDKVILFDLGDAAGESNGGLHMQDFLEANGINWEDLKAVFISHAHFDHWGSLGILKGKKIPVYLTEDTYNLIGKVDPSIFREINICLLREDRPVVIGDSISVEPFANGHIPGSVGFILEAEGKRLVYTGDFCLHDQFTVRGLDLSFLNRKPVDVLVMETTYGCKEANGLNYEDNRILLRRMVEELTEVGIKVLLPAFAIGRAQEIIAVLADMDHRVPVLLAGQAVPVFYYFVNRIAGFKERSSYVSVLSSNGVESNLILYPVIVASSGMLKRGTTSYHYLEKLLKRGKFAVIQTGYMEEDENISFIKAFNDYRLVWLKVNLSAHAGYEDLLHILEFLQPEKAVMVHGGGLEGF
ncbi:RNA-metabolising metallo-beta-lactamase [Thermosyntropha lipolytica DSM 11003]|uniref:RNA-metabolising metallo-beta-lactamase n=1 Tax=Thermosyntropha lipolytica DSM 11003 TaxID=1123382 RepID=A0A1M5PQ18_9FIRM|nr:MBL fold metallo-hydrolase [Thermosyntropha lipolytica]SHH03781.1 RNA-metabolising metallo-beta-lactamase [Thermosyntropha lipolytica DSM 11003]